MFLTFFFRLVKVMLYFPLKYMKYTKVSVTQEVRKKDKFPGYFKEMTYIRYVDQ